MAIQRDRKGSAGPRGERIGLQVAKWGNSLALRLPAESARKLGVGEGDTLTGEIAADGRLVLSPASRAVGKADARRMRAFVARQKMTTPVLAGLRRGARY